MSGTAGGLGRLARSWAYLWLPAEVASARVARRFVHDTLASWDRQELTDIAALLVSELVTNAVLHAHTDLELTIAPDGERIRFAVADGDPHPPTPKHYGTSAATGRGLLLVEEMAVDWGTEPTVGGKTVWFQLEDVPRLDDAPHGAAARPSS